MSKTIRRIVITAFRHRRLAITGAGADPPTQPSTTDADENLVTEIRALVKQLTGDTLGATVRVSRKRIGDGDDNENETR